MKFIDEQNADESKVNDTVYSIPASPDTVHMRSTRQHFHLSPMQSVYKPIVTGGRTQNHNIPINPVNQIASSLKSAYRPFTLGPKKPPEPAPSLRIVKSSKHYNEDLLLKPSDSIDLQTTQNNVPAPSVQNMVEQNHKFNPLLVTYGAPTYSQQHSGYFASKKQPLSEKRPPMISNINPFEFNFTNPLSDQRAPRQFDAPLLHPTHQGSESHHRRTLLDYSTYKEPQNTAYYGNDPSYQRPFYNQ